MPYSALVKLFSPVRRCDGHQRRVATQPSVAVCQRQPALAGHCGCRRSIAPNGGKRRWPLGALVVCQRWPCVLGTERDQRKHHHPHEGFPSSRRSFPERNELRTRCSGSMPKPLLLLSRLQRRRLRRKSMPRLAFLLSLEKRKRLKHTSIIT